MTYRPSRWLSGLALALLVALAPARASADESPSAPELPARPAPERTHWYGYQTLIVDGASLLTAPLGIGLGGLVLGGPIVHLVHDRPFAALGSLGLRTALPVAGAFVGLAAAGECHEQRDSRDLLGGCFLHGLNELIIGALVGVGAAIAVDASALAYEKDPLEGKSAMPRVTSISPAIDPVTRSASVGLGGTF